MRYFIHFFNEKGIHLVVGTGVICFDNLAKCRNDVRPSGRGRARHYAIRRLAKEGVGFAAFHTPVSWGIALLDNVIYSI